MQHHELKNVSPLLNWRLSTPPSCVDIQNSYKHVFPSDEVRWHTVQTSYFQTHPAFYRKELQTVLEEFTEKPEGATDLINLETTSILRGSSSILCWHVSKSQSEMTSLFINKVTNSFSILATSPSN